MGLLIAGFWIKREGLAHAAQADAGNSMLAATLRAFTQRLGQAGLECTNTAADLEFAEWEFHRLWEMQTFHKSGDGNLLLSLLRGGVWPVYNLSELEVFSTAPTFPGLNQM